MALLLSKWAQIIEYHCLLPSFYATGLRPHKGPMRRAARWDGVFPLFEFAGDGPPDDAAALRDAVAYVRAQRANDAPFDFVYTGHTPSPAHTEYVHAIAEAGATWWLEILYPWIYGWDGASDWPVEAMRARILAGPPRG